MPALESFSRLCTVAELADVNVRQTERHVLMDEPNDQTYACDGGAVILHTERQRQRQRQRQRLAHSLALACNHSYTHTHTCAHLYSRSHAACDLGMAGSTFICSTTFAWTFSHARRIFTCGATMCSGSWQTTARASGCVATTCHPPLLMSLPTCVHAGEVVSWRLMVKRGGGKRRQCLVCSERFSEHQHRRAVRLCHPPFA